MKYILMAAVFAGGPIPAVVNAEETPAAPVPPVRLLEAARTAGAEASPLVFARENFPHPKADRGGGISGKSVVLATAIASVAAVTVAWLLRPRSECVPAGGAAYRFARAWSRAGSAAPALPLPPSGLPEPPLPPPPPTPQPPESGTPPPPPPPLPPPPLPRVPRPAPERSADWGLCVARGSFR